MLGFPQSEDLHREESIKTSLVLRVGAFEVDLGGAELRRNGSTVQIEDQPFRILALLLERPGRIVTREELIRSLWPAGSSIDLDRSLEVAVSRLRQALEDRAEHPNYLQTIPGRGYRLIAPVKRLNTQRRVPTGAWAAAALVVILVVGYRALFPVEPPATGTLKLAVLPFKNLQGTPQGQYLAAGMTEEMIGHLGPLNSRLEVIALPSTVSSQDNQMNFREIGSEFGVDYFLTGSVSLEGDNVRIRASLTRARDQKYLWSQPYDRTLADVLAFESEVAERIARSLPLGLNAASTQPAGRSSSGEERATRSPAVNKDAYIAYLEGRYLWNKRTPQDLLKSISFFQQALAKDPNYARAYAGMADAYNVLGFYSILSPSQSLLQAKGPALRALQLDDSLAEAHASLADILLHYDYDWKGAEKEFRRAIELNPSYATAHHLYSVSLSLQGRVDEGMREILRAHELDPLSPIISTDIALNYFYARQYDRAVAQCKKTLELDPKFVLAHMWLGRAYAQTGKYEDAIPELQKAVEIEPGFLLPLAVLGNAYAVAGKKQEARDVIQKLEGLAHQRYVSPALEALVYAGLGEKTQALLWGDRAYREHASLLTRLSVDPIVDVLRSDPRFQDLQRRVGPPR